MIHLPRLHMITTLGCHVSCFSLLSILDLAVTEFLTVWSVEGGYLAYYEIIRNFLLRLWENVKLR